MTLSQEDLSAIGDVIGANFGHDTIEALCALLERTQEAVTFLSELPQGRDGKDDYTADAEDLFQLGDAIRTGDARHTG